MAVIGMKAETNRIRLEEHIPLDTPMRVAIDVSSVCNFHCQYCPHGSSGAMRNMPQAVMPVELAKKCIDDLTKFPKKIKKLSLSDIGEPLINKNLPEIAAYAAESGVADCLCITTNASLLTPDMAERLISGGIKLFDVSIYGLNADKYREFSGCAIDFERLVKNIAYLYSIRGDARITVKITDAVCGTKEEELEFQRIFSPISDVIAYERAGQIWYDLDICENKSVNIYGEPTPERAVCPIPFYTLVVQSNGIVTPCSNDWKQLLPIGDAHTQSLADIWNGAKRRQFCTALLKKGAQHISPCNRCGSKELCAWDNIDSYRLEILQRLEK